MNSSSISVKAIHWEIKASREDAIRREAFLKSGKGREWLKSQYEKRALKGFERQAGAWYLADKVKIGYEISFTRYFYKPQPMRSLEEIRADLLALEQETEGLLGEIIGEGA